MLVHPNSVSPSAFAAFIDDASLSLRAVICCCAAFAQKKSTRMRYLCDDSSNGRVFSPRCTLSPSPSRSPCNAHLMSPKKFPQSIGGASNCCPLLHFPWCACCCCCCWFYGTLQTICRFCFTIPFALDDRHRCGQRLGKAFPLPLGYLLRPNLCCHALTSHGRRRNRVAVCCMRCLFVSAIPNEARAGAANEQANEPRAQCGRRGREKGVWEVSWIPLLVLWCVRFFHTVAAISV